MPHHEIVYPWLVHPETDEYISHNVDSRRSRRSASSAADHIELPVIAVKFSGLGEDFHVKVAPNERLMPATFYVSAHHHDGKNSTLPLSDDFACHHHGIAVSHDNSPVAISTCDGVVSCHGAGDHVFISILDAYFSNCLPCSCYTQPY